ncbi:MAG TPA: tripartite tricarboxylate transporter permease [Candidatus Acidoferrales bacterium]|nr:tripartite tricarboxylate transporter permease [Candidatus Acidoferrales bacterium]
MLDAYVDAAGKLFTLWPLLSLGLGVAIGLINGALPAGGSIPLLVILMGFAYGMDPYIAIPLVIGAMAVNGTTDPIPCILLGIPGAASAQATILDGHPLARQGRAGYALSAAYASSLVGGLIGAAALALFVPVARIVLNLFGSVEFFVLSLIGVAIVGVVSTGALVKGLLGAAFGLAIALIGVDGITGTERFVPIEYLWEGIPLVPAIIGLFALPEILDLVVSDKPIARSGVDLSRVKEHIRNQRFEGILVTLRHKFLVARASLIGLFVGMMPGVGGSVAHWLAYVQALQTEKNAAKTFGTGDIRGVIAPESANNSIDAGVLMPTLAFGIPGSGQMAVFLGFLILLGLQPGPMMLNQHLDLTLMMVWSLAVSNIIATIVALFFTPQLARIAALNPNVLAPIVLAMLFVSAFQNNRSMGDLVLACALFGVGWFMKRYQWPRVPIILGLVLARPLEKYMWLSLNTYGWAMLARPQVWILVGVSTLSVLFSLRAQRLAAGGTKIHDSTFQAASEGIRTTTATPPGNTSVVKADSTVDSSKFLALVLEGLFLLGSAGLFAYFVVASQQWPASAALLPRMVGGIGLLLLMIFVVQRLWPPAAGAAAATRILDIGFRDSELDPKEVSKRIFRVVGSMGGLVAGVWLVGFHITIPLFLFSYCTAFGGMKRLNALIVAAVFEVFMIGVYDRLVHVVWNEPVLLRMLGIAGAAFFN